MTPLSTGDDYGTILTESTTRGFWYRHTTMKLSFYFGADNLNTTAITSGTRHHYGVTYDGTTVRFYLDGIPDGTAAVANAIFIFDAMFNDPGSDTYAGGIAYQRLWYPAVLSGSEMANVSTNPYEAVLRPIIRRRYFVPTGAGSGRLLAGERNRLVRAA